MSIRSKKDLQVRLSRLKTFKVQKLDLEQYPLHGNIAADWIWQMALKGEVANKTILDAGCGPGIIGLGLLLMGAKKVFFLDKDPDAIKICQENYQELFEEYEVGQAEFINQDISLFDEHVDIVVQNPPFGTKQEHADKLFLEKAFAISNIVYSMHKFTTATFIEAIAKDHNFEITHFFRYDLPIKAAFQFHEKPVVNIDVGLWRLERK